MVPEKYTRLGFKIAKFGAHSLVLKLGDIPIFVFNSGSPVDTIFITHICETYLKLSEKRKDLSCIKA
jgi:hypothetical protein